MCYIFWVYVCSHSYPACKAHAPYNIVVCGLSGRLYHIFPHYLTNDTIFGENLLNIKCVFCFRLQILSEIILIQKKNKAMHYHKCIYVLMYRTTFSCQILMKRELHRQIFEKYSDIKFYENLSGGSRVVPWGRTYKKKLMVAFRNFVNAPKIDDGRKKNKWGSGRRWYISRVVACKGFGKSRETRSV
jgi:hypothetical protein